MDYAIDQKEGFLLVTGEPGTGKTTLLNVFLRKWQSWAEIAMVLTPRLSPEEFLTAIVEDLDISLEHKSKNEMIKALRDFMTQKSSEGKRIIIIVDEAQNLPPETLEELRLLSNLETDKDKLLQIILLGQPELEEKLSSKALRQLNQRITTRIRLRPLNYDETGEYVKYRIMKASSKPLQVHKKACVSIYRHTRGIPRLINMLVSRALMAAYLEEGNVILDRHIHHALESLNHSGLKEQKRVRLVPAFAGALTLLLVIFSLYMYLGNLTTETVSTSHEGVMSGTDLQPDDKGPAAVADDEGNDTLTAALDEEPSVNDEVISDRPESNAAAAGEESNTLTAEPAEDLADEGVESDLGETDTVADAQKGTDSGTYEDSPYKLASVKVDVAFIRSRPSVTSHKSGVSFRGNQLVVLDESTDEENRPWYQIAYQGGAQWISGEVVEIVESDTQPAAEEK